MDEAAFANFVEQVRADALRTFGPAASAALLDRYAREAVLDLWLTRPRMTVAIAQSALAQLRPALAARPNRRRLPAAA